ncbi:MAG: hypothetical protein AABX38_05300 [Candidatus Micrarchaeota archaeon]
MQKVLFLLLISIALVSLVTAEFNLDQLDVTIKDVKSDGSARVRESIRFFINTPYDTAVYENGFNKNDLSFWANATGINDVRLHVDPNKVDIQNFRILPQPRKCNPFLNVCRGELILDYTVYPYLNINNDYINSTGLFKTTYEKPRTTKYTLNPSALLFRTSDNGDVILDNNVYLVIIFPQSSLILDVNPLPSDIVLPSKQSYLKWNNIALVKFSTVFEVEESIDKEVSEFFANVIKGTQNAITGKHGPAIFIIVSIFAATYIYLQSIKKK